MFAILFCLQLRFFEQRSSNHHCSVHTQRVFTQVWIISCLLCPAFLYAPVNSLTNIIELECSCCRHLEKPIVTSLLFVYFFNIASCCVHLLIYLLFFHSDVVGLLWTNFLYRVRHLTFFFSTSASRRMVTLSSCLICEIISFILSPNKYGCVHTSLNGPAIDLHFHHFILAAM